VTCRPADSEPNRNATSRRRSGSRAPALTGHSTRTIPSASASSHPISTSSSGAAIRTGRNEIPDRLAFVALHQGEGRAGYLSSAPVIARMSAGQMRSCCTQIAAQGNDIPGSQNRCQPSRQLPLRARRQIESYRAGIRSHTKLMPGLNRLPQWDINKRPFPEAFPQHV